MCYTSCAAVSEKLADAGISHAVQTRITATIAVALFVLGILAAKAIISNGMRGPFLGGGLILASLPFTAIACYRARKN